jgi:hypothetical protein
MVEVNPDLGAYIVVLEVDDSGPVRWEKTTKRRDHYTLWGSPAQIRACVVSIEPV